MTDIPLRLAVLIGSVRDGRIGPTVAHWFADRARSHGGFEPDLIDIADYELPIRLTASPTPSTQEALAELTPRLAAAEAFAIVTPEYNHSYPASLKNVIDWHHLEWAAKPVGLISYGGMAGGLRATEHLRQVFPELHATTVRDTVSFHRTSALDHGPWDDFGGAGKHDSQAENDATAATKVLLDQLEWWGNALRDARGKRPYQV
ncbi:hypothetical protein AD006_30070 (plasmid) [Pseudonocardia sp. EC080610-09]|uniref:NADPH-dependent FMN reductase n=1 Tax=unclassified Pseudonocardia TaxID=2619320 RepID=UPI000706CA64|nr:MULTISPECIES: NAD(P)H-dependent oxidoreductase [unclassified Pseudonocardia]ALL79491.1 hypothetical protein AD006_30070 [Pseudonocardia sp. EC080610-09]ALL85556.1 hypothetical protein AD017_31180 [Pseudonocardia sp. EC080619-01]